MISADGAIAVTMICDENQEFGKAEYSEIWFSRSNIFLHFPHFGTLSSLFSPDFLDFLSNEKRLQPAIHLNVRF
jgi:hypothetical protein